MKMEGVSLAALEGVEGLFSFDTSPLQKLLLGLVNKVELCQQENAALRSELNELKVEQRLSTLEQSIQEIAELQQPDTGYGSLSHQEQQALGTTFSGGTLKSKRGGDPGWILFEFNQVKERIGQIERKSEALWHSQESDQEILGLVDRLKKDVDSVRHDLEATQTSFRASQLTVNKLEDASSSAATGTQALNKQIADIHDQLKLSTEEKASAAVKLENNVSLIWSQIRHMENSLSQRLTLTEATQASTLQEMDDMKESSGDAMGRVEDVKRHIAALEGKLESFNTQVAAAISPLHSGLSDVKVKLEELKINKQDISSAVTLDDVGTAVSREIDHADRRADNLIKSIAAMENRVEDLNAIKANKSDIVMTTDLEALLTAHASELDRHLEVLKEEILHVIETKADKEEMAGLDAKIGARVVTLETAILKGLKAISDKVSAALTDKLDLLKFNEFKLQVRAILADVEDRLKDWSPMAKAYKVPMDGSGVLGASSCLSCDSRVRSVRDLQSMGFSGADRVFSPEKVPATEGLLPRINRSPDTAAHNNAKLSQQRKKDAAEMLRMSVPPALSESQVGGSRQGSTPSGMNVFDPGAALMASNQGDIKVDVETISGSIAQGRLPGKQISPTGRSKSVSAKIGGTAASFAPPAYEGKADADPSLIIDTTAKSESPS